MTFGEKLAEARKEKGLSQEELAKQIFVTRQALSRWEICHEIVGLSCSIQAVNAARRNSVDAWSCVLVDTSITQHIYRYNVWLMKTHSIVRTNRFYVI